MTSPDPSLSIHDRQQKVPGHDLVKLTGALVGIVGAGGLGSPVCRGLARKGIGGIRVCDPDRVEASNLARQDVFFESDIGQPKAWALVKNLEPHCTSRVGCELVGYHCRLEDLMTEEELLTDCQAFVIGVDNGEARVRAAELGLRLGVPVVFSAVDLEAEYGYVFCQTSQRGEPCFGCRFPNCFEQEPAPCGSAASPDVLCVMTGLVLRAVDSMLGMRVRLNWNYRETHLNGWMEDTTLTVQRRENCPLCGTK